MNTQAKLTNLSEDTEVNILSILNQILEHKWLVLITIAACLTVGIVYISRQVPQYQSDLLLQVEARSSGFDKESGFLSAGSSDSSSTQTALIQSRFVLEPVIQSLGLDISAVPQPQSFWHGLFSSNHRSIHVKSFVAPRAYVGQPLDLVLDKPNHYSLYDMNHKLLLQGDVGRLVTNHDKTIRLYVEEIIAPIGARFVIVKNTIGAMVAALHSQLVISEASRNTGILDLSLIGPNPSQIVKTLNAVANIAQAKDAQKKAQEASQTLTFLYKQLPITKSLLEKAETALNVYRAKSGKIDSSLQTKFLLDQLMHLEQRLNELRVNRIELLQRYTIVHPVIIALDRQVHSLEAEKTKLDRQIKTLPASEQVAVNLLRDIDVKKTLYIILLNKIQELQVAKAGTVSSIRILATASEPDSPLPRRNLVVYLASVIAGLVLSGIYLFGRRLLFPKVDDPHWSERNYNVANLAIVPFCKEQSQNSLNFLNRTTSGLTLLAHSNPRNLSIESLRSLRTSLQVMLPTATNNIVSILGVSPGVGKSFVSANLAYLLATAGKKVVLIDGDLRRGTVHKYFNTVPSPGIADILNDKATLDQTLRTSMHPNLKFLPRGTYPTDPSELLMSEKFSDLVAKISSEFDVVIFDTAPVLLVTDAVLIGAFSATNFLVLGAGVHQPTDIDMVLKRLSASDVAINGTIFNFHRAATITQSYGSYARYGKYHTYYYDESMKDKR
jgi:tyrosine-protein kinase Etk/Wzc